MIREHGFADKLFVSPVDKEIYSTVPVPISINAFITLVYFWIVGLLFSTVVLVGELFVHFTSLKLCQSIRSCNI